MTPTLIGINGRMGSGKDTAFEIIQALYPDSDVRRLAFADLLKLSATSALGMNPQNASEAVAMCEKLKSSGKITITWDDPTGSPRGVIITGREYLQYYGTEAHRDLMGSNFWVEAALPDDWYDHFPCDIVVITDVRFPNEAQRISELGGEIWRVDADERLGDQGAVHVSEKPLDDEYVNLVIKNNTTLSDFAEKITEAMLYVY